MVEIVIHKIVPVSVPVVAADNLWAEFGQLKIADSTRKQYVKAIENFCQFAYNSSANPETISEFLDLDRYAAIEMVVIGLWTRSREKRDEGQIKKDNDGSKQKSRHHSQIYYANISHSARTPKFQRAVTRPV
jgi:hypothetical protein